jgi:hypothetical protein
MKIISRKDAKAQGLKRYHTGKPCKHGHVAERLVSNATCIDCLRVSKREYAKTPASRARVRKYNKTPAGRAGKRTSDRKYAKTPAGLVNGRARSRKYAKTPAGRKYQREYSKSPARRKYLRERLRTDVHYNAKRKLRCSFRYAVRCGLVGNVVRGFEKRHGYTIAEFLRDFEKKFTKGMTREKFLAGQIDIDHIIPLMKWSKPIDVKAAWGLENLQPLWKHVNNAKRDQLNYPANVFYVYGQSQSEGVRL